MCGKGSVHPGKRTGNVSARRQQKAVAARGDRRRVRVPDGLGPGRKVVHDLLRLVEATEGDERLDVNGPHVEERGAEAAESSRD